jgi:hypothetical protein
MPDRAPDTSNEQRKALEAGLRRVLRALGPYLADLVLIGGWVPYLHRRYGGIERWDAELSFTSELDVLVATGRLDARARPPLADLLQQAGLRPANTPHGSATGAAVWTAADGGSTAIEFLIPHTGPLRSRNPPVAVRGQQGIAALMLTDLGILERHTMFLQVPLEELAATPLQDGSGSENRASVRVPRLGAYVLNKAMTFPRRIPRSGERINPKRAKDLLYLRDVVAAGTDVIDVVVHDIERILATDLVARHAVDAAVSSLDFAVAGTYAEDIDRAAMMLVERAPGRSPVESRQDIEGYLVDLLEILRPFRTSDPAHRTDGLE